MPSLKGNRQGLDVGSEYRSIILCEDEEQLRLAQASKEAQQVWRRLFACAVFSLRAEHRALFFD